VEDQKTFHAEDETPNRRTLRREIELFVPAFRQSAVFGAPKVDRLVLKTMGDESPKVQVSGGETAIFDALKTTRSTFKR
jgi:hypothetical protein